MRKIQPKKAAEAPMAAALMSVVLKRQGKATNNQVLIDQAEELERIARENEKTPQGPLAPAVRRLKKAMKPVG